MLTSRLSASVPVCVQGIGTIDPELRDRLLRTLQNIIPMTRDVSPNRTSDPTKIDITHESEPECRISMTRRGKLHWHVLLQRVIVAMPELGSA